MQAREVSPLVQTAMSSVHAANRCFTQCRRYPQNDGTAQSAVSLAGARELNWSVCDGRR
jgi:hypothetical protein